MINYEFLLKLYERVGDTCRVSFVVKQLSEVGSPAVIVELSWLQGETVVRRNTVISGSVFDDTLLNEELKTIITNLIEGIDKDVA